MAWITGPMVAPSLTWIGRRTDIWIERKPAFMFRTLSVWCLWDIQVETWGYWSSEAPIVPGWERNVRVASSFEGVGPHVITQQRSVSGEEKGMRMRPWGSLPFRSLRKEEDLAKGAENEWPLRKEENQKNVVKARQGAINISRQRCPATSNAPERLGMKRGRRIDLSLAWPDVAHQRHW